MIVSCCLCIVIYKINIIYYFNYRDGITKSDKAALPFGMNFTVADIDCEGDEKHLLECRHSLDVEFCSRDGSAVLLQCIKPLTTTGLL